ncbi:MAG TPA: ABC transporter ATP-binding protein [Actinomycetota bacterium]|nr:ABC transporter ATP-binding protein [Actinomycetota bacterium]
MALLEVRGIHVYYGAVRALTDVSLEIKEGEMVSLLGPNGAGKSTTLRTVSGLMAPREGEIYFDGQPVHNLPAQEIVNLGIAHLPEGRELFPSLTVEENLRFGYYVRRKQPGYADALERAYTFFPKLKERRNQAAGTMSGGEQQMLGMARSLMSRPKLLLIDEMSLGLAPLIVQQLFDILETVNKDGTAALVVEQFVHMALGHTSRAYVLSKGEVALEGPSLKLRDDPELLASYLGSEAEPAAH